MRGPGFRAYFKLLLPRAKYLLHWWPIGDIRAVAVHPWSAGGGYAFDPQPLWRKPKMKRIAASSPGDRPRHNASLSPGALDKLPGLIDFVAVIKYDDNSARQGGAFRVSVEGAEWCVRVSDPDSAMSFVARGETLWDALMLAELLVTSERCPWSPDKFLQQRATRKKKDL